MLQMLFYSYFSKATFLQCLSSKLTFFPRFSLPDLFLLSLSFYHLTTILMCHAIVSFTNPLPTHSFKLVALFTYMLIFTCSSTSADMTELRPLFFFKVHEGILSSLAACFYKNESIYCFSRRKG